jgi:hypothetical protein
MLSPEQMLAVSDDQLLQQAQHCLDIVGRRLAAPSNTAAAAAADGHAAADNATGRLSSLPGKETAVVEATSAAADTMMPVAGAELVVPESVSLGNEHNADPQLSRQPSVKAQQRQQQQQVQTTPPSARRPRPSVVSRLLDDDDDDDDDERGGDQAGTASFKPAASLVEHGPQHAGAAQQHQQQGVGGAGAAGVDSAADAAGVMRQPAASARSRGSIPGRKDGSSRSHLAALASRFLD